MQNLVFINTLLSRLRHGSYNFSTDNDRNNGRSTFLGACTRITDDSHHHRITILYPYSRFTAIWP